HEVSGVLLANQSTREQSESRLHEQHEVACQKSPGKISAYSDMPYAVRQFCGKRFFGHHALIVIESFFLLSVVRSVFIGGFRYRERIAPCINCIGLIARCQA